LTNAENVPRAYGATATMDEGPIAFTTEVHLLQSQTQEASWMPPLGDDYSNNSPAKASQRSDDSLDSGLHVEPEGSAYVNFLPLYKQITSCVKTREEHNTLQKAMHEVHGQLLRMNKDRAKVSNAGGTISLPETDRRKKDKRIKPVGSPDKKKRHGRSTSRGIL